MWGKKKFIGMTEAVRRIGTSSERLRYWELKGVITPTYLTQGSKRLRRYSLNDIELAKEIRKMIDNEGFSLKGAAVRMNRPYRH